MVQWFCVTSWKLFDVQTSCFGIMDGSTWKRSWEPSTLVNCLNNLVSEFSETPHPAYFYANFSCCTHKKSFRRFFCTPVFSVSTCIIIVNFSLCSYQRRRLGVKISYCQQIKKITEALRLTAWCLSENGRRGVHVASACRNSQSEARILQWINTMSHVN